jgi:hypothetical protein
MTSLWELSLGASEADVKFVKGEPTDKAEGHWIYWQDESKTEAYIVGFRDMRLRYVQYIGPMYSAPRIKGLNTYGTLQETEAVFGKASNVSTSKDGLMRLYSFDRFNVVVEFGKGRIRGFGIYDSSTSPLKYVD